MSWFVATSHITDYQYPTDFLLDQYLDMLEVTTAKLSKIVPSYVPSITLFLHSSPQTWANISPMEWRGSLPRTWPEAWLDF